MAGEVVERAVADEHVADEQHDLGQEREREEDRRDRAELGDHVVDAGDRPGEHQRQHVLTAVRAHDVGRDQRDEQQQRRRHADVVAVGDDLDPLGEEAVARDVADADVDDRRDRDDAEEHERRDLLPPRPPDAERPAHRRLVQGERRRAASARACLRTGGSRGRRRHRRVRPRQTLTTQPSARRRNTSSSDVSRVDSR